MEKIMDKKIIDKDELKELQDQGLSPDYIKEHFQLKRSYAFTHEQVKQYAILALYPLAKLDTNQRKRILKQALKMNEAK
jgi:hypothetical protein